MQGDTIADYLTEIQLSATANYGYHFTQWGDGNTDNPRTILLTNDTNIVNGVNTENISETIGSTSNVNVFREDEVKTFEDEAALLQNAPEKQNNMFSIPKVI